MKTNVCILSCLNIRCIHKIHYVNEICRTYVGLNPDLLFNYINKTSKEFDDGLIAMGISLRETADELPENIMVVLGYDGTFLKRRETNYKMNCIRLRWGEPIQLSYNITEMPSLNISWIGKIYLFDDYHENSHYNADLTLLNLLLKGNGGTETDDIHTAWNSLCYSGYVYIQSEVNQSLIEYTVDWKYETVFFVEFN